MKKSLLAFFYLDFPNCISSPGNFLILIAAIHTVQSQKPKNMFILSLLQDHFHKILSAAIVGKIYSLTCICGMEEETWEKREDVARFPSH